MNKKALVLCFLSASLLYVSIISAAVEIDSAAIEEFLDNQVNPKDFTHLFYITHKGPTGLAYLASFYGRDDLLAFAHQRGADLSFQFIQDSCIKVAAKRGHSKCVEYLLKNGVSVTTPDFYQPIHEAAREGHIAVVKLLIQHGADVDTFDEDGTPLMFAAANGQLEMVKELLKMGANPKKSDRRCGNATRFAREGGYTEIVAELEKYM